MWLGLTNHVKTIIIIHLEPSRITNKDGRISELTLLYADKTPVRRRHSTDRSLKRLFIPTLLLNSKNQVWSKTVRPFVESIFFSICTATSIFLEMKTEQSSADHDKLLRTLTLLSWEISSSWAISLIRSTVVLFLVWRVASLVCINDWRSPEEKPPRRFEIRHPETW